MRRLLHALILMALAGAPVLARPTSPSEYDWGFLASRHADPNGDWHTKALGPFYERVEGTNGMRMQAWRPAYAHLEDPATDRTRDEVVWPLAQWRTIDEQAAWRVLFFLGFNHDTTTNTPRKRAWIFPFWFSGRDATGGTYRALFPFYGSIHEFLGRDEINFVCFPIRSTSRVSDLYTSNWLWPFISVTHGPGVLRYRVFPFYARSVREGQTDKRSILWPFWSSVRYDDPHHPGGGFMLWPLYGQVRVPGQVTRWYLPPFFKFAHAPKLTQINAPWPFIQYERSKQPGRVEGPLFGRTNLSDNAKLYVWPLWGRKQVGNVDRTFALWPFLWWQSAVRPGIAQHRFQLVPFFIAQSEVATNTGAVVSRYNRVWPLYSYRRVGAESRFRTLDLWPLAQTPAVDRSWSPLWTVYSRHRVEQRCDTEVLWGLYRDLNRGGEGRQVSVFPLFDWNRSAEPRRSWSLLKGLVGRDRRGSQVSWRLLYFIRLGGKPEAKAAP